MSFDKINLAHVCVETYLEDCEPVLGSLPDYENVTTGKTELERPSDGGLRPETGRIAPKSHRQVTNEMLGASGGCKTAPVI